MNRERFVEWVRHQLEFWATGQVSTSPDGRGWTTILDRHRRFSLSAHEDGTVRVQLSTTDEDLRTEWAGIFRDVRAAQPPWPPGPTPEGVGELELLSDATGQTSTLQFAWMFYGTNFLQELPAVSAAMSWLLLAAADIPNPIEAIELEETEESLELEDL